MSEGHTTRPPDGRPAAAAKRVYHTPRLEEFGSVSKLTTAKTGTPTDAGMPMTSCL